MRARTSAAPSTALAQPLTSCKGRQPSSHRPNPATSTSISLAQPSSAPTSCDDVTVRLPSAAAEAAPRSSTADTPLLQLPLVQLTATSACHSLPPPDGWSCSKEWHAIFTQRLACIALAVGCQATACAAQRSHDLPHALLRRPAVGAQAATPSLPARPIATEDDHDGADMLPTAPVPLGPPH